MADSLLNPPDDVPMDDATFTADAEFKHTLHIVRENLQLLREDLKRYRDLKDRKGTTDPVQWAAQVKELDMRNKMRVILIRSGQRQIFQMVEHMKRKSEEERRELDSHNLTLQSLLYGKDYFLKEVHFCKEFKTPHLK